MLRILGLAVALLALGLGCAGSGYYYESRGSNTPAISDLPPAYYDYDSTMQDWFTAPYWNPDVGG